MTGDADLAYLFPLFDLAAALAGEDAPGKVGSFGLAESAGDSSLARDDAGLNGFPVSHVVAQGIGAALDHALTFRALVLGAKAVTNAAPWTLLRGTLEPASTALWVLSAGNRERRQERALRFWRHDMAERGKWEADTGVTPPPSGRSGADRAKQVVSIAQQLGLRANVVNGPFNHADCVMAAGETVGWSRAQARGLWRECSGFAHGSHWPALGRSTPVSAERTRDGYYVGMTLAEDHHRKVAELTHAVLDRAVADYARASAGTP
jgi:hypothetical protein